MACYLATLIKFQSTLPREERPVRRYSLPLISVNFNPRSHERSDVSGIRSIQKSNISIHAPTRGATAYKVELWIDLEISIHAPTRGATQMYNGIQSVYKISIHAPTRGATTRRQGYLTCSMISIHAPTRGATCQVCIFRMPDTDFNPRSHERSDALSTQLSGKLSIISIHAPTRGAT